MFKGYYRQRFLDILGKPLQLSDGIGDRKVNRALRQLGLSIPRALGDYLAIAGNHPINKEYNRLLPVEKLHWRDDKLVFMEENQQMAVWGIDRTAINDANPVVWKAPDSKSKPLQWQEEPYLLHQFIMAMWNWQKTKIEEPAEFRS
jgi:hypothetical protein